MGYVFVVQHGGIFGEFDQVDGERGDFGDHDAAEGVGDGYIGVGEGEFYFLGEDGDYFYFWDALVSHFEVWYGGSLICCGVCI